MYRSSIAGIPLQLQRWPRRPRKVTDAWFPETPKLKRRKLPVYLTLTGKPAAVREARRKRTGFGRSGNFGPVTSGREIDMTSVRQQQTVTQPSERFPTEWAPYYGDEQDSGRHRFQPTQPSEDVRPQGASLIERCDWAPGTAAVRRHRQARRLRSPEDAWRAIQKGDSGCRTCWDGESVEAPAPPGNGLRPGRSPGLE